MRKLNLAYLFTGLFLLTIACDNSTTSSYNEDDQLQSRESAEKIESFGSISEESNFYSSSTLSGEWVRVGSSGTGKDISVEDVPYIIGGNNKIYYFDYPTNNWVQEPGGGEGKMISYTINENTSGNTLYLRGNNDKIYEKDQGSSGGWSVVIDGSTRSISTYNVFNDEAFLFSTYSDYVPYTDQTQLTQEYTPKRTNDASLLRVEELAASSSGSDLYAIGWVWQYMPCCYDYGDGIFKMNSNNVWEDIGGTAIDIAVGGPNDDVWIVGSNQSIYKYINNQWVPTESGTAKRISVSKNGIPYIIGNDNRIYKFIED